MSHQKLSLSDLPLRGVPRTLVVWQTAPRLTSASCYSKYQGIPTPLSTLASQGDTNSTLTIYLGDTNTPVYKAERLTLIQRQPCRLCRTWHLFSVRLTLHTEDFLYGKQTAKVFQRSRSSIHTFSNKLLISQTSLLHRFIFATKAQLS